jgi:predicted amidophosphoribosyltransferase
LTNLRGKVVPRRRLKEIPREVYLIDDVWTTGSTLRECIGVLKRMGVESVHGVSLVRD